MNIEIVFSAGEGCRVLTLYEIILHQCPCLPANDVNLFVIVVTFTVPNYSDSKFTTVELYCYHSIEMYTSHW